MFTGFFALGLVLVSKTRSNIDLTHILFGNVLGITAGDIQQTLLISALVLVLLLLFRRDLMLFCFDPTHARSIGINTGCSALHAAGSALSGGGGRPADGGHHSGGGDVGHPRRHGVPAHRPLSIA